MDIYKVIIESKLPLSKLKVKIPETLATFDTIYWLSYDFTKGCGYMKDIENWNSLPKLPERDEIQPDTKFQGYVDTLEYIDTIIYGHLKVDRSQDPACLTRCWDSYPHTEQIEVVTWDKLKQMYSDGPPSPGIMQKFVTCPSNKATLYRLVFFNPNNSDERADYGFGLSNNKTYTTPNASAEVRCLHISETQNSFSVFKIIGKTIKEFSYYAYNLCQFIEKSQGLMIENMVVDFTKDEFGNIFFLNVKSFKLVYAKRYNELAAMSQEQRNFIKSEMKERADKTNNTVQGTLGRINFK